MSCIVKAHIGPIYAADIRWGSVTRDVRDWRPQRMTLAELLVFARAAADREIYLAQEVHPFDEITLVFPAQSFLHEVSKQARREVGTCYEYLSLAVGKTRAGQPVFGSIRFVHIEDWLIARDMIAAEILRRERMEA